MNINDNTGLEHKSHNTADAQNFILTFPVDLVPFQMQK